MDVPGSSSSADTEPADCEAHGSVLQLANRLDRGGCEAVIVLPVSY
jgi:hypothetical protein